MNRADKIESYAVAKYKGEYIAVGIYYEGDTVFIIEQRYGKDISESADYEGTLGDTYTTLAEAEAEVDYIDVLLDAISEGKDAEKKLYIIESELAR